MCSSVVNIQCCNNSMEDRHTSIFHFSDTLTYLIKHLSAELCIVVLKELSWLEGTSVNFRTLDLTDYYAILVCFYDL